MLPGNNHRSGGTDKIMKIKWIDDTKEIPGVGVLSTGDIRDIPKGKAEAYIKQGQAIKFISTKKEV